MSYQQMANLYDYLMAHAPYDEWVSFTEEILKNHSGDTKRMVDFGCGTGEITTKLASKGYEMTGVDYSSDMLAIASQKATEQRLNIQWLQQDLRELDGLSNYDVAISYCDVINYITEPEELSKTMKNINDTLKPGGIFLFDVHDLEYIEEYYLGQTFAEVEDEISYIWKCSPGDEQGEMYHDLTFFYLQEGKYERFDEQHVQRTYKINFYKNILIESGFENIKVYADFSTKVENLGENPSRIFFSAIKG
ncbi:class I SAM-dependent DNA methyltransferase [Oceanobacillus sp. CAU 1775]